MYVHTNVLYIVRNIINITITVLVYVHICMSLTDHAYVELHGFIWSEKKGLGYDLLLLFLSSHWIEFKITTVLGTKYVEAHIYAPRTKIRQGRSSQAQQ